MSARPVHGYSVSHIRSSSSSVLVVAESRVASRSKPASKIDVESMACSGSQKSSRGSQFCLVVRLALPTIMHANRVALSPRLLSLLASSYSSLYGPCTVYHAFYSLCHPLLRVTLRMPLDNVITRLTSWEVLIMTEPPFSLRLCSSTSCRALTRLSDIISTAV